MRVTRSRWARPSALLAAATLGLLLSGGLAGPAVASPGAAPSDAGTTTVTIGDSSDAWYATPARTGCVAPGVCPTLAGGGYPAGTVHVALAVGSEAARAYVTPDLAAVPPGFTAVSGTMTLPLDRAANSGNLNPQTAKIRACLSFDPAKDGTAGPTTTPPQPDCAVTAPVQVGPSAFTLDLAPFLAAWNSGTPNDGIALLPVLTGSNVLTAWHVSFVGHRATGQPPISSTLALAPVVAAPAAPVPPSGSGPGSGPGTAAAAAADQGAASDTTSAPAAALPAEPAGTISPGPALAPSSVPAASAASASRSGGAVAAPAGRAVYAGVAARGTGGFQYPASMLLPLVLLAGALFALRLFTTDATPSRRALAHLTVQPGEPAND